eukprot:CAMPEP_0116902990 /NCGR_PEP_ID=MMETSP0467-20121206/10438_1 /TAXON_ID=283647 /ORGANISM="Mesodinium pulex, Strain SPMC105" /LENGTH=156 /DNA_ID=CAMNT_0004577121 /DNA_START=223 /DNA_END=693 /DNA_ORIENTATION=+
MHSNANVNANANANAIATGNKEQIVTLDEIRTAKVWMLTQNPEIMQRLTTHENMMHAETELRNKIESIHNVKNSIWKNNHTLNTNMLEVNSDNIKSNLEIKKLNDRKRADVNKKKLKLEAVEKVSSIKNLRTQLKMGYSQKDLFTIKEKDIQDNQT